MNEKRYCFLKATADDELELIYKDDCHFDLEDIRQVIDGFFEVVVPTLLQRSTRPDIRILCDDNGLYKGLKVNKLATSLYGAPTGIVGDVIFCTSDPPFPEDEPDVYLFSAEDGENLKRMFEDLVSQIKHIVI